MNHTLPTCDPVCPTPQATQAYLCGNKALARELGRRGREANEAMKAEHGKAAARIFSDRNRHLGQQPGPARPGLDSSPRPSPEGLPCGVLFVDLHGLHAAEAAAVPEAQIGQARAAGCRGLRVCTGTGKHTKVRSRGCGAGQVQGAALTFRVAARVGVWPASA